MSNIAIEAAKEIEKISLENNISVLEIIEEYKKAHSLTDQSKSYEHDIENFKDIIPQKVGVNHR